MEELSGVHESLQVPNIEIDVLSKEMSLYLWDAVVKVLPEVYRQVFWLRVEEQMSFKEIAKIFDKTDHWACVMYHRARQKIQTAWEGMNHV